MNKFICIHGHFYQPPRENPWLEFVELQDSAYPYHDWNDRISSECYAPNTASRIISPENKIIDIVNNYSKISFNFGPTLLSWLSVHRQAIYEAILEADRISMENFSGHGSALAQCYNHIIMPLANRRDKETQIIWGIEDFKHHFSRMPEGMWLPETAADMETLDLMAEHGIKFTILAPGQAQRTRSPGSQQWNEASGGAIDPRHPYLVRLPSGNNIAVFFYDGAISHDIGFGKLLEDGLGFAQRLVSAFSQDDKDQLVNIATDGETYGHHHRFGEMALSYCLYHLEANNLAKITNYGQYLQSHPPQLEAEIVENSSWSCAHGVCRWNENCGCHTGAHPEWNQQWRKPLRQAMDWLRDRCAEAYDKHSAAYLLSPWDARNNYIKVILDRSEDNVAKFMESHQSRQLAPEERVTLLKLCELQRHAMLIFTSCGWFFDDISGIESVQILMYAARALQLIQELTGQKLTEEFKEILSQAPSNKDAYQNGSRVYEQLVEPAILDLLRVGANYALSSIFEKYPEQTLLYCYQIKSHIYEKIKMGRQKLAIGRCSLTSTITGERTGLKFAVLHLGDHNLIGGIHHNGQEPSFDPIHRHIKESFLKSDIPHTISLMDQYFGSHNYSLWHLFKDKQREIISMVTKPALKEIEQAHRQIYDHNYPVMQAMNQMNIPLPPPFASALRFIFNTDLQKILSDRKAKTKKLGQLVDEIMRWPIQLDTKTISYVASQAITEMIRKLYQAPRDKMMLSAIKSLLQILQPLNLDYDLWEAQNLYFYLSRKTYPLLLEAAKDNDAHAREWVDYFQQLDQYMPSRSL